MMESVKNIIEELMSKLGMDISDVEIHVYKNTGIYMFNIKTGNSKILIGRRGETLRAINTLVKELFKKADGAEPENGERKRFIVDINDYHKSRFDKIVLKCEMLMSRVKEYGVETEMEPMTGMERYIVHSTVSERPDIISESRGEGSERRVVLKPNGDNLDTANFGV